MSVIHSSSGASQANLRRTRSGPPAPPTRALRGSRRLDSPLDAELAHDRGDRVVAGDDLPAEAQLGVDAVRTVDACRITMNLNDLAGEEDPSKRSRRGRTAA